MEYPTQKTLTPDSCFSLSLGQRGVTNKSRNGLRKTVHDVLIVEFSIKSYSALSLQESFFIGENSVGISLDAFISCVEDKRKHAKS